MDQRNDPTLGSGRKHTFNHNSVSKPHHCVYFTRRVNLVLNRTLVITEYVRYDLMSIVSHI